MDENGDNNYMTELWLGLAHGDTLSPEELYKQLKPNYQSQVACINQGHSYNVQVTIIDPTCLTSTLPVQHLMQTSAHDVGHAKRVCPC